MAKVALAGVASAGAFAVAGVAAPNALWQATVALKTSPWPQTVAGWLGIIAVTATLLTMLYGLHRFSLKPVQAEIAALRSSFTSEIARIQLHYDAQVIVMQTSQKDDFSTLRTAIDQKIDNKLEYISKTLDRFDEAATELRRAWPAERDRIVADAAREARTERRGDP